ncbi:Bilin biosynthesis protein CpeY [Richelia intracellularis HM01]|uniref:HEAT repeat domain-containing protein n=1 Tax=Richelia intracellularis TaxID=1164990 RepID=UPI0002B56E2D|nr:HEAT repeat domain-containing protein [Richelia intracellularis]CCH64669.1 Bilin biosynthesis protein CpeY [Richelia intracellularis HM01]
MQVGYPDILADLTNALIAAIENKEPVPKNPIIGCKAVETLGYFRASAALPIIHSYLGDEHAYTVENAVWAIREIGTRDKYLLEEVTQLLEKPHLQLSDNHSNPSQVGIQTSIRDNL